MRGIPCKRCRAKLVSIADRLDELEDAGQADRAMWGIHQSLLILAQACAAGSCTFEMTASRDGEL
jgi:hypothetical protein